MKPDNATFTSAREPGRGYHDLGGLDAGPVDYAVTEANPWEKLSVVIGNALGPKGAKVLRTDEIRRVREEMGVVLYNELRYFEKNIEAIRRLLIEKSLIQPEELESRMAQVAQQIAEHGR